MSRDRFEEECPGCRPVLIDVKTGQACAPDSREQQVINALWDKTTKADRVAWHAVTCLNSRVPDHIKVVMEFTKKIQEGIA